MIVCKDLIKELGNPPQRILHGINLVINDGEFVSISGKSGSGKSTLLYLISTLDLATSGSVTLDGNDVGKMDDVTIHAFRNKMVGRNSE